MRTVDEPIPDAEDLYRALHPDHVQYGKIVGAAISLPVCCVARSKYGAPDVPLIQQRPADNGIGVTTRAQLPPGESVHDVQYELDVRHTPEQGPAHAEIQLLRASDRRFCSSSAAKQVFREKIANRFEVHTPPKPI